MYKKTLPISPNFHTLSQKSEIFDKKIKNIDKKHRKIQS